MRTPDFELFTDASGEIGYGAYFKGAWFTWDDLKPLARGKCIKWKELYVIVLTAATWSDQWKGLRIKFHCDNLSVVYMWTNKGSRRSDIMCLVHTLFYIVASGNFHVSVAHIPGVNNCLADALSRLQFDRPRSYHHPKARLVPLGRTWRSWPLPLLPPRVESTAQLSNSTLNFANQWTSIHTQDLNLH